MTHSAANRSSPMGRRCARPSWNCPHRVAPRCWCGLRAAGCAIPTCTCRTAISNLAGDRRLDVTAGRALPFTLATRSPERSKLPAPMWQRIWRPRPAKRSQSIPGSAAVLARRAARGRKSLRRGAPSRHCGRRRLRDPCAGAASPLSFGLRAADGGAGGAADVLGPHRLCGAETAHGRGGARTRPAGRPRRGRHDGPGACAYLVRGAAAGRRHRRRQRDAALAVEPRPRSTRPIRVPARP